MGQSSLRLAMLTDDRHYFPPYDAVPLVRQEAYRSLAADANCVG